MIEGEKKSKIQAKTYQIIVILRHALDREMIYFGANMAHEKMKNREIPRKSDVSCRDRGQQMVCIRGKVYHGMIHGCFSID